MNNKMGCRHEKNQLTMLVLFVTMLINACGDDDSVIYPLQALPPL